MTTVARTVIDSEHDGFHAEEEPRDAATLIIIDRSATEAKVLLGRRHMRHVFLPGKFVFPGGRVDPTDWTMPSAKLLHPDTTRKLLVDTELWSETAAQALALAAVRETFEETGMVIGAEAGSLATCLQVPGPNSCRPATIPIRRCCSSSHARLRRPDFHSVSMRVSFVQMPAPSPISSKA